MKFLTVTESGARAAVASLARNGITAAANGASFEAPDETDLMLVYLAGRAAANVDRDEREGGPL